MLTAQEKKQLNEVLVGRCSLHRVSLQWKESRVDLSFYVHREWTNVGTEVTDVLYFSLEGVSKVEISMKISEPLPPELETIGKPSAGFIQWLASTFINEPIFEWTLFKFPQCTGPAYKGWTLELPEHASTATEVFALYRDQRMAMMNMDKGLWVLGISFSRLIIRDQDEAELSVDQVVQRFSPLND